MIRSLTLMYHAVSDTLEDALAVRPADLDQPVGGELAQRVPRQRPELVARRDALELRDLERPPFVGEVGADEDRRRDAVPP